MHFARYLYLIPFVHAKLIDPKLHHASGDNSKLLISQDSNSLESPDGSTLQFGPRPDILAESTNKAKRHNQLQASKYGLIPGEVFGLVTLSSNPLVDQETVVIYNDGTLGIKEPRGPGYLFQALLIEEYGLMLSPEPLTTVKLDDKNVFFLNDSLFNPAPIFSSRGWDLQTEGGSTVVCPSWNSVLVYVPRSAKAPCADAINVGLKIVPITGEKWQ